MWPFLKGQYTNILLSQCIWNLAYASWNLVILRLPSTGNWFCEFVCLMVFNATFNNISVISWRSVLLVEETGGPRENHRPVTSHIMLYTSPWSRFELATSVVIGTVQSQPRRPLFCDLHPLWWYHFQPIMHSFHIMSKYVHCWQKH
jgi:hypothetical protein